jgi:hypothetical protein
VAVYISPKINLAIKAIAKGGIRARDIRKIPRDYDIYRVKEDYSYYNMKKGSPIDIKVK